MQQEYFQELLPQMASLLSCDSSGSSAHCSPSWIPAEAASLQLQCETHA